MSAKSTPSSPAWCDQVTAPAEETIDTMAIPVRRLRPSAWGGAAIETGSLRAVLRQGGVRVSELYRVTRDAEVLTAAGTTIAVRLAGLGGLWTRPDCRRQGYSTRLEAVMLRRSQREGDQVTLLFCLPPLVEHYRRRGWVMGLPVTYQQPGSPAPVACAAPITAGVRRLDAALPPVSELRAIAIGGLPW